MKRHGEIVLNLYKFEELYWLLETQSGLEVEPIKNKKGELVGCRWQQLNCIITLIEPSRMENENTILQGTLIGSKSEIALKSEELANKLFIPWELHLPLYIVVHKVGDYGKDDITNLTLDAFLKAFVRIIIEELKESIGGWIPEDKQLIFSTMNWNYDVKLHSTYNFKDRDVSNIKSIITQRLLGTNYNRYYL